MSDYVTTFNGLRDRIERGPIGELPTEQEIRELRALRWMPDTEAEVWWLLALRQRRARQASAGQ